MSARLFTTPTEDERETRGAMCVDCNHRVKWHHDTEGCDYHGRGPRRCPCALDSDQVVSALIARNLREYIQATERKASDR